MQMSDAQAFRACLDQITDANTRAVICEWAMDPTLDVHVDDLARHFDVDDETIRALLLPFLQALAKAGITGLVHGVDAGPKTLVMAAWQARIVYEVYQCPGT